MTVTEILSQSEFHEALKNNQLVAVHFHSGYIPKSELMIKEFKRLAGKNPAKFLMVFIFNFSANFIQMDNFPLHPPPTRAVAYQNIFDGEAPAT